MYRYLYLSFPLSIYPCIYPLYLICLSIIYRYLSIKWCISIHLSISRSLYLSIDLSIYQCIYLFVFLSVYLSIYLSIYLRAHPDDRRLHLHRVSLGLSFCTIAFF